MAETKKRKLNIRLSLEAFEAFQAEADEAGTGIHNFAKMRLTTDLRKKMLKCSIEAFKKLCPSRNNRGCSSTVHKAETKTSICDGNCARIKYLVNEINKNELR